VYVPQNYVQQYAHLYASRVITGFILTKLKTDLLSNRRLRNNNFSVTLKNTHQLHFSRRKVQLHFSNRKLQLVAVALFFKLRLHFSE
jgi:hypothetical protein